jgi:hypothetical protein
MLQGQSQRLIWMTPSACAANAHSRYSPSSRAGIWGARPEQHPAAYGYPDRNNAKGKQQMLKDLTKPNIRAVAQRLWEDGVAAEPAITAVYLFPSNEEIRLIYLDPTAPPSRNEQTIAPFYFGSNAASSLPYPSAIAVIRPQEKDTLGLPEGWGEWTQAERVWET